MKELKKKVHTYTGSHKNTTKKPQINKQINKIVQ